MIGKIRKLSVSVDGEYEVRFDLDEGKSTFVRCRVTDEAGERKVVCGIETASPREEEDCLQHSDAFRKALLSFDHAVTARYPAPARPVRHAPPGFDPTPLRLREIEAVGESEYELRLVEPDGSWRTITERVIRMSRGDADLLGVETVDGQAAKERTYPQDIQALTVNLHRAIHSGKGGNGHA